MKKSYFFKFFVFALVGALAILPSCQDYDDDISRLDKELGDAKTELTGSIASQLAALKTELNTSVDNKVKTVADDLAASKSQLAALEANSATKAQLDAVKAEILEQVVTLEVLEDLQADYDSEIAAILARIATLEEDGATKEDLAALETEITGMLSELQDELDAIDVRVTALDTSLTAFMAKHDEDLQDVIASIATLKAELDPRISTIETLLDIAEGKSGVLNGIADDLAAHLTKIGANADAIALLRSDLEAELADQLVLINANKTAIEAVETDLAAKYAELVEADADLLVKVKANYDELDGKITLNKDAIDALTLRVDAIEEEIEDIKDSITALEEDLNIKIGSLFTLAKNRLTSITLAPNAYLEGIEAVKFTSLNYSPMEAEENALVDDTYTMSIGAPAVASYKFNPRTFVLGNADYNYVDRTAEIIMTTRAAGTSNFVEIVGAPEYKPADGTVNFTLRRLNAHSTQAPDDKENFIALEATLKGAALAEGETGVVVAAPQELVYDYILDAGNIRIADKATLETAGNDAHYPTTFDAAVAGKIWYEDMTYDKVYDLLTKVATCTNDGNNHEPFNIEDYGLKYKFYVASSAYNITTGSTVTNQQSYIELVNGDEGTFKAKDFNKEAIGRTPIFKVELVDGSGNVVRRAFVKVKIGVKKTEDILVGKAAYDLLYDCEGEASYVLDEVFIRENVYRVIENTQGQVSLSHEEFWNMYELDKAEVTKDGNTTSMTAPVIVDGDAGIGTATKKIVWTFDKSEIGKVGNGTQLVATLTVKNKLVSSEYPEYVTFRFVVNVTLPTFELDKVENEIYWENNQYQVNIAVPNSPTDVAANAIFRTSLPQAYFEYDVEFEGNDACGSYSYKVVNTFSNGGKDNPKLSGVAIDGDYITLDKNSNAVKAALNSTAGLQAEVQHVYSYGNDDEVVINTFMVNFVRPVNFNMPDDAEVVDATDDGDEVDFNWGGLLTDWRGKAILAPGEETVSQCSGEWIENLIPTVVHTEGYYRVLQQGSFEVETGEVSFVTGGSTTMYTGTANWRIERRSRTESWSSWGNWQYPQWADNWATYNNQTGVFTTEAMLTQAEVDAIIESLRTSKLEEVPNNVYNPGGQRPRTEYEYRLVVDPAEYGQETMPGGQLIEYTYIKNITYVPTTYEWVPAVTEVIYPDPTDAPEVDGTADGDRSADNNWVWTVTCVDATQVVPGQYWDFYGPFGDFTADFDNVTTNLDYTNGKLPADVTLSQVGTTIKYVNVGAPVGYEYEIYVPATVTYGWGTLSTVLTIVVNPVN